MQRLFEGPILRNIRVMRAVDYAIAITSVVSEIDTKKEKPLFSCHSVTFSYLLKVMESQ